MLGWLEEVASHADALLAAFDPAVVTSADAAAVVVAAAAAERRIAAIRVLAAARSVEGGEWRRSGASSAAAWLASTTGTTQRNAAATIRTSEALVDASGVADALRAGALSEQQAAVVAPAVAADPGAEPTLLGAVATSSVEQLRQVAAKVQAAVRADALADAQARVHADRHLRTWVDDDGGVCGRFRLTALAGARLKAALAGFHEQHFRAARDAGRHERHDALQADALVSLAEAATSPGDRDAGGRAVVVVRVDIAALARGRTEPGDDCSIDGIGPVPVAVARSLWGSATLAALLTDGPRVIDLRLPGRTMPTRVRMAVHARDRTCVVPRCGTATGRMEIHHVQGVEAGGLTELRNLARVCGWHHDEITYRGATLTGQPGDWIYTPPPGGPFDDGFTDADVRPPPTAACGVLRAPTCDPG